MKAFMDKDFLLETEAAKVLYHQYAAAKPIIDYHCHIPPEEIATNRRFDNIAQAWLGGDHYKWRLMRANGVDERYITGDASDREKFQKFAETLPKAVGGAVYHWTYLELRRYFGYDGVLNGETAGEVWEHCNKILAELPVNEIIARSNVYAIVTTDDPVDSLDAHKAIAETGVCSAKVLPGWRPDKATNINKPDYVAYIKTLSAVSGVEVNSMESLFSALKARLDHFESVGCRSSDHGLDYVPYAPAPLEEVEAVFQKKMVGDELTAQEMDHYKYALLQFLGREYARRGWAMQLHYGALRNTNDVMFEKLGPDTGYDTVGQGGNPGDIAAFLNALNKDGALPKTVLYSLNSNDNGMLVGIADCFQEPGIQGKIQHGAAWWFNDTRPGMEEQMRTLASMSVLGNFIGMLTDSRSFLSYFRHEYFRRILCNLVGGWMDNGEIHADLETMGKLVADISFDNVKAYFGL